MLFSVDAQTSLNIIGGTAAIQQSQWALCFVNFNLKQSLSFQILSI